MKKFLLFCFILTMVLLTACGRGRNGDDEPAITLTYANWNLGERMDNALELRMIQSFMDHHPHIRVEIDPRVSQPWTESLAAAASQNRLPDVFMLDDIGAKAANGWLMDITSQVWADVDFFDLTNSMQEAMRIGGVMYAVPFALNIHGYFVNRDLLQDMGINPPTFGVSAEAFLEAVSAVTDFSRPSIGLNHAFSFVEWYPSAVNPLLGFFAFDGLGFALDSPEMLEAVSIASRLHGDGYAFDGIIYGDLGRYFPADYAFGTFMAGQMAFLYGSSWLAEIMINQVNFDWAFIGVPGGRAIVTLEVLGISSESEHPEEAYMLARWMGHGTEGSLRRLEYTREMGIIPVSLPATQNRYVLEKLWEIMPVPGLREIYASMDRALIDGLRVLPGYMQARFSAPIGVEIYGLPHADAGIDPLIRFSIEGGAYFPDYSLMAEMVARRQLDAALAAFR